MLNTMIQKLKLGEGIIHQSKVILYHISYPNGGC